MALLAPDNLLLLRHTLKSSQHPVLSKSTTPVSTATFADDDASEPPLSRATHLHLPSPSHPSSHFAIPLDTPTRFVSGTTSRAVPLRSVLLAWRNRDALSAAYLAALQELNAELKLQHAGDDGFEELQPLVFGERQDLCAWLAGESDESEYLAPLDPVANLPAAGAAADLHVMPAKALAAAEAMGAAAVAAMMPSARWREPDPRLFEIYKGERRTANRKTVLRGIKPTDFSHIRKHAATILARTRQKPGGVNASATALDGPSASLAANLSKKPGSSGRRPEPIILLSPSASSILRMSNAKRFLEEGAYVPAETSNSAQPSMIQMTRMMPSIDAVRPIRFFVVETPDQFKPDYWSRLVAVFTTGQTWQFKTYKWTQPADLFQRALAVYVGWKGDVVPDIVKGWGRMVKVVGVDKWNAIVGEKNRWRDREVMEDVWMAIEESMRSKGWGKDGRTT